jgi:hypothetical protein
MRKFKLPISPGLLSNTVKNWAAELRSFTFVGRDDFQRSTYVPLLSATGTMTIADVRIVTAEYYRIGDLVWFWLSATFTTGGVASTTIFATLPVTASRHAWFGRTAITCGYVDDGSGVAGKSNIYSESQLIVQRYNLANFGLGTSRAFSLYGCYEAEA